MSVRIRLTKDKDAKAERDAVFEEDVISIGREEGNTLQLAGTLVSKRHARIEGYDRTYRLVDLRSTNSTFLNDEEIVADTPYDLHLGDHVRIGEYVLEIVGFEHGAARKVADAQMVSPEAPPDDVEARLAGVAEEYAGSLYIQQRARLKQALVDIVGRLESSDVEVLSSSLRQLESECQRLRDENRRLQEAIASPAQKRQQFEPPPLIHSDSVPMQRVTQTIRGFVQAFSRLVRGRSSFRNEFLGATTVSGGELSPLLSGSADEGLQFLFDNSASDDEFAARSAAFERELDALVLHVVGLLDGYRTSIDDGVRMLLQKTNPEVFRRQLARSKLKLGPIEIPYRFVPFFLDWKMMQLSKRIHQELLREDRGVLEKQYFRRGFIQGYEKCVASLQGGLEVQRDSPNVQHSEDRLL